MIATGPPAKSNRRILCGSESTEGAQRASVQRIVKPHRNLAVGCQKLYGSQKNWKKRYGYHKRSLSETEMCRVKQLLGRKLNSRNYNAQVGETYAMIKVQNKLMRLGMPET